MPKRRPKSMSFSQALETMLLIVHKRSPEICAALGSRSRDWRQLIQVCIRINEQVDQDRLYRGDLPLFEDAEQRPARQRRPRAGRKLTIVPKP